MLILIHAILGNDVKVSDSLYLDENDRPAKDC